MPFHNPDVRPKAITRLNGGVKENGPQWDELDAPLETLRPPEYLTETANELWNFLVNRLAKYGVILEPDRIALEALCETYSFWTLAAADVRELGREGRYYTDSKGNMKLHPSITYYEKMDGRLRSWLVEFGLSPSARARWRGNDPVQQVLDEGEEGDELVIDGESLQVQQLSNEERKAYRELLERHRRG